MRHSTIDTGTNHTGEKSFLSHHGVRFGRLIFRTLDGARVTCALHCPEGTKRTYTYEMRVPSVVSIYPFRWTWEPQKKQGEPLLS